MTMFNYDYDVIYACMCVEAAMGLCEPPVPEVSDDELFEGCFECPDNE